MPPKRSSSTTSQPAKSEPSKPAKPAKTAKAAASAGNDKASASKARAKPKPVAKLVPEYPLGNPRRSTRQCQKRTGSVEDALPSKKAKPPPDTCGPGKAAMYKKKNMRNIADNSVFT